MAITDIEKSLSDLDSAKARLSELREGLDLLQNMGAHQRNLVVNIGGIRIDVSETDRRSYMATVKRGHEMMHLGAIKVFQAKIGEQEAVVDRLASEASDLLEAEIQEIRGGKSV